ncbi:helix-turn-helix domain-containing protein [bacterium]|nr:helix-turn-helix domain-containing protein [bacterium]
MNIEIANRLLQYRKKNNLSQEELAAKIGVSRQAVSKWERAEASPDTDNLILLAQLYGVTLDELLTGKKENAETAQKDSADNADASAGSTNASADGADTSGSSADGNGGEQTFTRSDKVSFKNGIHVHSKDGDHVDISFKDGINVEDKHGTKVRVGLHGVDVEEKGEKKVYTDENGDVYYSDGKESKRYKRLNMWHQFPFLIVTVILFLMWGFSGILGGWAFCWLIFLTIPLYYSLVDAIIKRNPNHFAYPVLVVLVYLIFGLYMDLWHPLWVIFLTIPAYYGICKMFKGDGEDDD